MIVAIRIEDSIIAFVRNLYPKTPSLSISSSFILFVGRILIDQVANIFIYHCTNPAIGGSVELKSFLVLALVCSYLHFFAGDGAVNLIE